MTKLTAEVEAYEKVRLLYLVSFFLSQQGSQIQAENNELKSDIAKLTEVWKANDKVSSFLACSQYLTSFNSAAKGIHVGNCQIEGRKSIIFTGECKVATRIELQRRGYFAAQCNAESKSLLVFSFTCSHYI